MNSASIIRQPENLFDRIWRYMSLPKLIGLLDTQSLYMARADTFDDQHEGATPDLQKSFEIDNDPQRSALLDAFRRRQREWTFITCWSHGQHESHALWKIFCPPKQGIVVGSQYFKLASLVRSNVEDMEIGLVDYGIHEPLALSNTLLPFFRKRKAFDYEREVRLVANIHRCTDVRDQSGNLLPPLENLKLPVDVVSLVDVIRVHPEASRCYSDLVRSVVREFAPTLIDRVEKSEMSRPPNY